MVMLKSAYGGIKLVIQKSSREQDLWHDLIFLNPSINSQSFVLGNVETKTPFWWATMVSIKHFSSFNQFHQDIYSHYSFNYHYQGY